MRGLSLGLAAGCVALAFATPAAGKTKDKLIFVDGRVQEVDGIIEEGLSQVRVRGGQAVDARMVLTIVHADAPAAFSNGEAALRAGQFQTAVERFEASMSGGPAWVTAWATVGAGEALSRAAVAGDGAAGPRAVSNFQRFLDANADHFLEPRALRGLGEAQRASGQLDDARATFERLADRKYGDYWEIWGKVGLGEVLLARKDYTEALKQLGAAIQIAKGREGFGEILGTANAAKGQTYMAKGDYDQAIAFYEQLARGGEGTSAQSAADSFVNLGKAYEERGKEDDTRRALMEYRRVAMYYTGSPGAYAEALLRAGKLLEAEGKKDLAQAYFRELKARCPESPQARQVN
jgi:tetratricopeptide (TPR) repeat protein